MKATLACSLRMVEEITVCGCLLLADVTDLRACSKKHSWFSVFSDISEMISVCCGALYSQCMQVCAVEGIGCHLLSELDQLVA